MTDPIKLALFREIHLCIASAAEAALSKIATTGGTLSYPPTSGSNAPELTETEISALSPVLANGPARNGLRKLLTEAAAAPVFHLLSLMDGVVDPQDWSDGVWVGAEIVSASEDTTRDMLHDAFMESYWETQ